MELADTSVWVHRRNPVLRDRWEAAVTAGDIAGCDVVALELLHSARNPTEFALLDEGLRGLPWLTIDVADWSRVREVYRALGSQPGMPQRSVRHADLLIAAVAERNGITLIHDDADHDTIAAVTGQPMHGTCMPEPSWHSWRTSRAAPAWSRT